MSPVTCFELVAEVTVPLVAFAFEGSVLMLAQAVPAPFAPQFESDTLQYCM